MLTGAFPGSVLAVCVVDLLRTGSSVRVGVPDVAPSAGVMLPMLLGSLLLVSAMVSLAVVPAWRVSYSEPAIAVWKSTPAGIWYDSVEEVMPCLKTD